MKAARVLVWLGLAENESDWIFDKIAEAEIHDFSIQWIKVHEERDITKMLYGLGLLHLREYWTRVWMSQEIAYASDALVLCGSSSISYSSVVRFTRVFGELMISYKYTLEQREWAAFALGRSGPNGLPEAGSALTGNFLAIEKWMRMLPKQKCSDPRDFVFGLHGCFPPAVRNRIDIDYSLDTRAVFRLATKSIIEATGAVYIICYAPSASTSFDRTFCQGLPSWTPDYSHKTRRVIPFSRPDNPYRASGSLKTFIRFPDDAMVMQTRGVIIGSITNVCVTALPDTASPNQSQLRDLIPLFQKCQALFGIPANCQDYDNFLVVLHAGTFKDEWRRVFASLVAKLAAPEGLVPVGTVGITSFEEMLLLNCFTLQFGRAVISFSPKVQTDCQEVLAHSRKSAVRNLGLASDLVKDGDKICVLQGFKAPVVLRPAGGYHMILGDAYIHGYMYGEAVRAIENGHEKPLDFFLR